MSKQMEQQSGHSSIHSSHSYNQKRALEPPFVDLFLKLRDAGILLTVDDYKLLITTTRSGFGLSSKQELKSLCSVLWIKSIEEERVLDKVFSQYYEDQAWIFLSSQQPASQNKAEQGLLSRFLIILKGKKNLLVILFFLLIIGISSAFLIEKSGLFKVGRENYSSPSSVPEEVKNRDSSYLSYVKAVLVTIFTAAPALFMTHLIVERIISYDDGDIFEDSDRENSKGSEQTKGESKVAIRQEETSSIDFGGGKTQQNHDLSLALLKSLQKKALTVRNDRYNTLHTISSNERLSLRQMKQVWRYLRKPTKQGIGTRVDIKKTVDKIAQQGMFLSPVFESRKINRAEVILMIDWGGSMLPFHSLAEDLMRTALSSGIFNRLKICYFKNFPESEVFFDRFFMEGISLTVYLEKLNYAQSSIIVVSDAGAARGNNNNRRYEGTKKFISTAQHMVRGVSWLNPMPYRRWLNTSAERISTELVPMFETTYVGMRNAVRVSRGESKSHMHSYSVKNQTQE